MNTGRIRAHFNLVGFVMCLTMAMLVTGPPSSARAQNLESQLRQRAGQSFQRGVALYNEGDFQAALIEFQRAYESAPNPRVLYNIGQTYYQLQRYAHALRTLERYVREAGLTGNYRNEARSTIELLRSRVGWVEIKSNVVGTQISIDDVGVGTAPLAEPVMVGVGRRKVTGTAPGRPSVTRYAEIAAGERFLVQLTFSQPGAAPMQAGQAGAQSGSSAEESDPGRGRRIAAISLWSVSGASALASIVTGILALQASSDLEADRERLGATREELDSSQSKAKGFAIATDVLLAAAAVSAGIALYLTLSGPDDKERATDTPRVQVGLLPTAVQLRVGF